MKEKYGFIEFESIKEFKEWLDKQVISRAINKLQAHHMFEPDYSCWETDNALRRQNNIKSFHKKEYGWGDIAQHFSVFPDGHIVTGRSLEKTPIGIKGWNTGAICIEIYGNFDKGQDIMNNKQKESVIAIYALLAKKFNIPISEAGIRCHCWFTASGEYLGGYDKYKSAKTCPGTNFMQIGNTKKAFKEKFYPLIKAYKYDQEEIKDKIDYNCDAKVICNDVLNVREDRPSANGLANIKDTLENGTIVTLGYVLNGWGSIYFIKDGKLNNGFVNVNYLKLI